MTVKNVLLLQGVLFRFSLENTMLKFENNCQIYDDTNSVTPAIQINKVQHLIRFDRFFRRAHNVHIFYS